MVNADLPTPPIFRLVIFQNPHIPPPTTTSLYSVIKNVLIFFFKAVLEGGYAVYNVLRITTFVSCETRSVS